MANKLRRKKPRLPGGLAPGQSRPPAQPPAALDQTLRTAQFFQQSGNLQQAAACYRQVLSAAPDHPRANYLLGSLFYQRGDLAAARPWLEVAVRLQPGHAEAQHLLGTVHLAGGRPAQAIACYHQALAARPGLAVAHHSLGIALKMTGEYQGALDSFQRALDIQPGYAEALANRGIVFWLLGRIDEALASYGRALILRPDFREAYPNFAALMTLRQGLPGNLADPGERKALLVNCLKRNDLPAQNFAQAGWQELFQGEVLSVAQALVAGADTVETSRPLLGDSPVSRLLSEPLFALLLQKTIVTDPWVERFLTALRWGLLELLADPEPVEPLSGRLRPLVCALARQCFWNEYVWPLGEAEEAALAALAGRFRAAGALASPGALTSLALLACYTPLDQVLGEDFPAGATLPEDLAAVLRLQLHEPRLERQLAAGIGTLAPISDAVSQQVRQQYEENPYPRWTGIALASPRPFLDCLRQFIAPNAPPLRSPGARPQVLVAGCGTGQHPIACAATYLQASVVAIDLSRASLAYAQRQANELGLTNIEFLQGDILDLARLGRGFDVIECSGVLHHMRHPQEGLGVLVDLLRPAGYLKIGLYSELARHHVVAARELVRRQGFAPTPAGIRAARQALLALADDHPAKAVTTTRDFYATSSLRDLIFHVQEHRFTLPEIAQLLEEFQLEFLGFALDPERKNGYLAEHGEDPGAVSLAGWHLYEQRHPETFAGMYDFWLRRRTPPGP